MVSFDCPEKAVTDELISESFVQEQKYLRFRSLTLRSLVAAVAMTDDVIPKSKSTSLSNGSRDAIQCCLGIYDIDVGFHIISLQLPMAEFDCLRLEEYSSVEMKTSRNH